jgi:hypothetical protein
MAGVGKTGARREFDHGTVLGTPGRAPRLLWEFFSSPLGEISQFGWPLPYPDSSSR